MYYIIMKVKDKIFIDNLQNHKISENSHLEIFMLAVRKLLMLGLRSVDEHCFVSRKVV